MNVFLDELERSKPLSRKIMDARKRPGIRINVAQPSAAIRNNGESFYATTGPVIHVGKLLGLFPAIGNRTGPPMFFSWYNRSLLYSFTLVFYNIASVCLTILRATNGEISLTFYNTGDFFFFASLSLIYILFIHLAMKWPQFASSWQYVEIQMKSSFRNKSQTVRNVRFITGLTIVLSLVEHISYLVTNFSRVSTCMNADHSDAARLFFTNCYHNVFKYVNYHIVVAVPVMIINAIVSFAWNFIDLFIVILSIMMAHLFKQVNEKLNSIKGKEMPMIFWRNARESYNRLSGLMKELDDILSPIVLISFANNLYFICLQLLNSLKPMESTLHTIYFALSFSYLVLRTVAVSIFAANIYDESKGPIATLFSVPSESYCVEVARFTAQVTSETLALTGCKFFSITRTLVLTVAGTIVTYEIVLVQFNSVGGENKRNSTITCYY